jgi:hypothetical protein
MPPVRRCAVGGQAFDPGNHQFIIIRIAAISTLWSLRKEQTAFIVPKLFCGFCWGCANCCSAAGHRGLKIDLRPRALNPGHECPGTPRVSVARAMEAEPGLFPAREVLDGCRRVWQDDLGSALPGRAAHIDPVDVPSDQGRQFPAGVAVQRERCESQNT